MKVIAILNLFPEDKKEIIVSNIKNEIQNSMIAFETAVLNGLLENNVDLEIINIPHVGYYPTQYKKYCFNTSPFYFKKKKIGINMKFSNLFLYKKWSIYYNLKKAIYKMIKNTTDQEIFILHYNLSSPILKAITVLKKHHANVKICSIIADLPEDRELIGNYILLKKALLKKELMSINKCMKYIDGYILLSEHMQEKLPFSNANNSIMIECIYDLSSIVNTKINKLDFDIDNRYKYILYSGKTSERFGVINLINSFISLKNKDYRLIICGSGSSDELIKSLAERDNRIIFKGNIDREIVLDLQRKVNLLVNPRLPEGKYTKYSFPSKNAEYLASGTPTLLYKLPGIPDEYYNYCYTLDINNPEETLALAMDKILSMNPNQLIEKSESAKSFIKNNKNQFVQGKKIINFISSLSK